MPEHRDPLSKKSAVIGIPQVERSGPNMGRWFWGAIILMALFSILLSLASVVRSTQSQQEIVQKKVAEPQSELSADELKARLSTAHQIALDAVKVCYSPILGQISG